MDSVRSSIYDHAASTYTPVLASIVCAFIIEFVHPFRVHYAGVRGCEASETANEESEDQDHQGHLDMHMNIVTVVGIVRSSPLKSIGH